MHDNLLYLYSIGWKETGDKNGQVTGRCPHRDHKDNNPSFGINSVTGKFNCFSCGFKGSSPVTLIMGCEGLSYEQARDKAYGTVNISLEPTEIDRYHAFMDECQRWFLAAINAKNPPLTHAAESARRYLAGRGVDASDVGAGLSHANIIKYMSSRGYWDDMVSLGMIDSGNYICGDRITIPITHNGRTIGFSMRTLGDDTRHKYLNMVNTKIYPYHKWMYGLDKCGGEHIYITEGVFDAIAVGGAALLGTAISAERASLLHKYKKIFIMFDYDLGGWKAVEEFFFASRGMLPKSEIYVCDIPCDPDETNQLKMYVDQSVSILHWMARRASRVKPIESMLCEVRRLSKRVSDCPEIGQIEAAMFNSLLYTECLMSYFAPVLYGGDGEWSRSWSELCLEMERSTGVDFFRSVRLGSVLSPEPLYEHGGASTILPQTSASSSAPIVEAHADKKGGKDVGLQQD